MFLFKKRCGLVAAIVLCLFTFARCQEEKSCFEEYSPQELKSKYNSYVAMQVTGFTLLGLGIATSLVGIWQVSSNTSQAYGSDAVGDAMMAIGIPIGIVGTVLGTIGTKKASEFKRCLSLDIGVSKGMPQLALRYTF
jgi:hypothetical protein